MRVPTIPTTRPAVPRVTPPRRKIEVSGVDKPSSLDAWLSKKKLRKSEAAKSVTGHNKFENPSYFGKRKLKRKVKGTVKRKSA